MKKTKLLDNTFVGIAIGTIINVITFIFYIMGGKCPPEKKIYIRQWQPAYLKIKIKVDTVWVVWNKNHTSGFGKLNEKRDGAVPDMIYYSLQYKDTPYVSYKPVPYAGEFPYALYPAAITDFIVFIKNHGTPEEKLRPYKEWAVSYQGEYQKEYPMRIALDQAKRDSAYLQRIGISAWNEIMKYRAQKAEDFLSSIDTITRSYLLPYK